MELFRFRRRGVKKHGILLDESFDGDEHCHDCDAACCRGFAAVELTAAEYSALEKLGAVRLEFLLNGRCYLLIENGCEFLAGSRCSIHEQRPAICRRFTCRDI
jgi:Fe-S-cluster containining protein